MRISLRYRIVLTQLPMLALLIILGGASAFLLHRLGESIDLILHENYDSVVFMERLNESVERIDSSFPFALAGRETWARQQYAENWKSYRQHLYQEQHNISLPGERELVDRLTALTEHYHQQGDAYYALPANDPRRREAYFGVGGLLQTFTEVKEIAGTILKLNQDNMVAASDEARRSARASLLWIILALAGSAVAVAALGWRTLRAILGPMQAVTESVRAIGAGNLDQVVPVLSHDELGELAEAFNLMARQLRHYRRTSYAQLLRAQQTSQAAIDSFPDPILVVDTEGRVEMANPAARRLLGLARRRLDDATAAPVWQPPELLRKPLSDALLERRAYLPEGFDRVVLLRQDGQDHFLLPRILPIQGPYEGALGAAVLLQDVTRFRLLDELKTNLVATVSHELKTPLTGIRLAVHLLLEEAVGPLTPKQTELLLDARENAERLLVRVDHLLDLARLEQRQDRLELAPEDPAKLLASALETIQPRADDKGVTLSVEVPSDLPRIAADAPRLGRAFDNLLDNALTHTERGGTITLSARAEDGAVALTVADTGCGIPAEHLPHIFDRFFRVPGQSVEGGVGLGLAIVKEILAAHGGSIACTSRPGIGTTFRMLLPIWTAEELTAASRKESTT